MKNTRLIRLMACLLCALYAVAACGALAESPALTEGEQAALEYLAQQLMEPAAKLMQTGEDVDDIYSALNGPSRADSFPEKFDLRQRGVTTSVKNQSPRVPAGPSAPPQPARSASSAPWA